MMSQLLCSASVAENQRVTAKNQRTPCVEREIVWLEGVRLMRPEYNGGESFRSIRVRGLGRVPNDFDGRFPKCCGKVPKGCMGEE